MPTIEERILLILGEATEPLFASEITEHLNRELHTRYTNADIVERLKNFTSQVAQLPDERWMLKRLLL